VGSVAHHEITSNAVATTRAERSSTVSRSFTKSDTGRIAVEVINHCGDEVLKVFAI
jgi:hypothetical protein